MGVGVGVRLGLGWGGGGETHSHCSLSDFGPQEWRVGSPSQEPLSRPEAAWKPFGLVGSHDCQFPWQQQLSGVSKELSPKHHQV